jgi:hypothetical protein
MPAPCLLNTKQSVSGYWRLLRVAILACEVQLKSAGSILPTRAGLKGFEGGASLDGFRLGSRPQTFFRAVSRPSALELLISLDVLIGVLWGVAPEISLMGMIKAPISFRRNGGLRSPARSSTLAHHIFHAAMISREY